MRVEHAIIMAAGMSSRFAPISYERPKALVEVRGEVLIERQIKQLQEAGIKSIVVVTGYMAEQFNYLNNQFGVKLIHNPEYDTRNNNGSLFVARDFLRNAYICSADNYFIHNPFESSVSGAYYALVYAEGPTFEWCVSTDQNNLINGIQIGGKDAWYMLGHAYFDAAFSDTFSEILLAHYDEDEYKDMLWESIFEKHIELLPMQARRYPSDIIFEFDSLDELREFDHSYWEDTRSPILRHVAHTLQCKECDLHHFLPLLDEHKQTYGFTFATKNNRYAYRYETKELTRL